MSGAGSCFRFPVIMLRTLSVLCFSKLLVVSAHAAVPASESGWTSARPDGHAPIGVMGDHTHEAGEWMLSYRYMFMDMEDNRDGTSRVSTEEIHEDFMVAPERMRMEMHMLGAMYAPTDELTLMFMLPWTEFSMDHVTMAGEEFTTTSRGMGDISVSGLYLLHRRGRQQLLLNTGISFPTGSINERDRTPMGAGQKLPYPMQPGSGTFDLKPGITWLGQTDQWSWGAQLGATVRLGRNNRGYSLGDRLEASVWGARKWSDVLSTSLRLDAQGWGNINGDDDELNPDMVPTADPRRQGGERVDLLAGVNLHGREGRVRGQRLALEAGAPVYESLDGPRLETDLVVTFGWQYAW